jgi:hypothetical protein
MCAGWAQRDEGMASDEVAECGIGVKVTPSEDGGGEPNSSGMAAPERDEDRDGFVFAEEPVFGYEAVTPDADFPGRTGAQVGQPIDVGPPTREDHDLAAVAVIGQDHRHHVVWSTGLATDVDEHEKRAA